MNMDGNEKIYEKKEEFSLTKNEIKVLQVLAGNARMSNEEIGRKTGLSRQTVTKTIKKLEEKRVILGYNAVLNLPKVYYKVFLLLVKSKPGYTVNDIEKGSKKIDLIREGVMVLYAGYFNGEYDFVLLFAAHGLRHASSIVNAMRREYSNVIQEIKLQEAIVDIAYLNILNLDAVAELKAILP